MLNLRYGEEVRYKQNNVLKLFIMNYLYILHILEKNYITYSEWTNDFGGAKKQKTDEFKRLPFYCCNLTLRPFEVAVCTSKGEIFDFMQIIPFLRKTGNRHPFREDEELKPSDLIRLTFHKNEGGEYFCPITRKTMNENSKIVANKKSGQVYLWETVETLNISKENWNDLVTDQPFTRDDLIILQDPQNPKNYSESFSKLKEDKILKGKQFGDSNVSERVNLSGGVGKVLKELGMTQIQPIKTDNGDDDSIAVDDLHAQATHSTGRLAASLTSTSMSLRTETEMAVLDEAETLSRHFPSGKETTGTICIRTNYGDLFFTLFASKSPRSCYNFIELAKKGYYDGVQFHRFVKGFILQGGDPTGSGRGGESIWKKSFGERNLHSSLSHNDRGILSMANSGDVNANGSQFFITLRPTPHLDGKHPIFGKLLSGSAVLDQIELEVEVDSGHRPVQLITIEDVLVLEDPFEEARIAAVKLVKKKKEEDVIKFSSNNSSRTSTVPQIGKYLVTKNRK